MNKFLCTLIGLSLPLLSTAADTDDSDSAVAIGTPYQVLKSFQPGDHFDGIRFLGALRLGRTAVNGYSPRQLSGLAWDRDQARLYAVSDDGYIVHFEPEFDDDVLTGLQMVDAVPLTCPNGDPLADDQADAEGLELQNATNGVDGDTRLLVAFEVQPRIVAYSARGEYLEEVALPAVLSDSANYQDANKELESLASHPEAGILTAPEAPLAGEDPDRLSIYSLDGRRWQFRPVGDHSALVGMETAPGGDVYVLERNFKSIFNPITFALRRVHLGDAAPDSDAPVTDVVRFVSSDGWAIDNFEAIARHEGERFFMISDDNRSGFQKTLLFYFEITGSMPEFADAPAR